MAFWNYESFRNQIVSRSEILPRASIAYGDTVYENKLASHARKKNTWKIRYCRPINAGFWEK